MRRIKATQATAATEIQKPDEQWRHELTRQQYDVLRRAHTEPAVPVEPVPAPERARARWYWTMPATTVPPAPSDVVDLTEVPTPP